MYFYIGMSLTELSTLTKNELKINIGETEQKFIHALKKLPDTRDNRGKRHSLVILIVTVVFATLVSRSKVSSIHRYMDNKIQWLREITGIHDAKVISRAHLPRMLAKLDWVALSVVINDCYGEQVKALILDEWISADGKVLRGTLKSGEKQAIIHAVSHESRIDVAQACQAGDKSSEITVMREFMKETGLEKSKMSLDAHHCNPETMAQIEQARGQYLIQVKENQPKLLEYCRNLGKQLSLAETVDYDLSHGLVCTREAHLHPLDLSAIDSRWGKSGLRTLVVMNRETYNKATQEISDETSYYLSNYQNEHKQQTVSHLAQVIRGHWVVESNNWQLDVTFGEDSVKTKEGSQALIMGKLRCFSMNLMRWSKKGLTNFQASIEKFTDSPDALISMLKQVNFL
jgi:predicted transposase YbfD/YdcC